MPSLDIDRLSDPDFVELVAQLFTKMGFVLAAPAGGTDTGVDFVAYSSAAIVGGKYLVQCQRTAESIDVPTVRHLHERVGHAAAVKGILVTTGAFTPGSKMFAAERSLELIDGVKLRELLATHMPDALPPSTSSPAWRLPPHFDPLCRRASVLLDPIWEEWDALRDSRVQSPRDGVPGSHRSVPDARDGVAAPDRAALDAKKYFEIVSGHTKELGEIVGNLEDALGHQLSFKNEADDFLAVATFAGLNRRVVDLRRSAAELQFPDGFAEFHATLLAAHDDLLSAAKRFHHDMIALRENPAAAADAEGRAILTMDFTNPGLNRLSSMTNEMLARVERRQTPNCAIATACFGDAAAPEVVRLRRWRNEVLLRTRWGSTACRVYAVTSPPIAALFLRSPALATLGRTVVRRVANRLK